MGGREWGGLVAAGDQFEFRAWPVKPCLGSDGVERTHRAVRIPG
jgi:hypothetical protein